MKRLWTLILLLLPTLLFGQIRSAKFGPFFGNFIALSDSADLASLEAADGDVRFLSTISSSDSVSTGGWFMFHDSLFSESGGMYAISSDSVGKQWIRLWTLRRDMSVINRTSSYTINGVECYNCLLTNYGATGNITINLPEAVVGMSIMVVLAESQYIEINPDDADRILVETDDAGDAIRSAATALHRIFLIANTDSTWLPVDVYGTWTDVN